MTTIKIYYRPPHYQTEDPTPEQVEAALRRKLNGQLGTGVYLDLKYAEREQARYKKLYNFDYQLYTYDLNIVPTGTTA